MEDPRFAKLPKWAQLDMTFLTQDRDQWRERALQRENPHGKLSWRVRGENSGGGGLPEDAEVRFATNNGVFFVRLHHTSITVQLGPVGRIAVLSNFPNVVQLAVYKEDDPIRVARPMYLPTKQVDTLSDAKGDLT